MGDRTTAYFTLGGKLTREAYDELLELIEEHSYIEDNDIDDLDPREALVEHKRFDVRIEEANYGNVDPFPEFAARRGLAYHHSWENGGGYGPGGSLHIPGQPDVDYDSIYGMDPALGVYSLKQMTFEQIQEWIAQIEMPLPPLEFEF